MTPTINAVSSGWVKLKANETRTLITAVCVMTSFVWLVCTQGLVCQTLVHIYVTSRARPRFLTLTSSSHVITALAGY